MKRRILALTVLVMVACTNRPLIKVDPITESFYMEELRQAEKRPVDILVVVDNSRSMQLEQANLAEQFPMLIHSLLNPEIDPATGKPVHVPAYDLHIGVISTDMGTGGYSVETCADPIDGDDGILQHTPSPLVEGCDAAYSSYLSYLADPPDVAAVEKMARDFGCIATLGIDGCGFEQQFKAADKALTVHASGANAGFLRPDSILTILFVTDEEDCSVEPGHEGIFDTSDTSLGHINLRCFLHPDMVQTVDEYVESFRTLREDPEDLVLGFIVGVPPVTVCQGDENGEGVDLEACLALEEMREKVDPEKLTVLTPSCSTSDGDAFPARRFLGLAQQFGDNAVVQSICTNDFSPAIRGLTDKLHYLLDKLKFKRELETDKDPEDECRCLATCSIIEQMVDMRECPAGRTCYEADGPGTGCSYLEDSAGQLHTMCVIPQAGTRIDDCSLECTDPTAVHSVDGEGWFYLMYGEDGDPELGFTESMIPVDGATVYIQCESMICPENRQCGPVGFEGAMCCDQDAFCDRSSGVPTCVTRPD
jgi:hypothetical protein